MKFPEEVFEATFQDGSTFTGGDLIATKWNKCPEGIASLKIKLPYGDEIILMDYEKFNFYVGAIKNLQSGELTVKHLFALGCIGKDVTSYRITIISPGSDKYKIGDITVRRFPFGKEGMGRTATSGWKEGAKK